MAFLARTPSQTFAAEVSFTAVCFVKSRAAMINLVVRSEMFHLEHQDGRSIKQGRLVKRHIKKLGKA